MRRGNTCSLAAVRSLSILRNGVLRDLPWAAGLAALAVMLLAAPGAARAAIVTVDAPQDWTLSVNQPSNDALFTQSESYSVSSSANVLVVQYGEFAQTLNTPELNPTIAWVTASGGTQNLTATPMQISTPSPNSTTAVCTEVMYLYNPTPGGGSLVIAGDARGAAMGAMTLSNVNTAVAPAVTGGTMSDGSATSQLSITLPATTPTGGFAAIAEGCRAAYLAPYTITSSNGPAPSQYWTTTDAAGYLMLGGAGILGLSGGATTLTVGNTGAYTNTGTRRALTAAVFSPVTIANYTWTGAASSNWNLTDANWIGSGSAYSNSSAVTFSDGARNTSISIAGSGVQPLSVTFTNNTTAYTFGGGAISGTSSVTLNGVGSVTFNNANTYTGSTTINAGLLAVNGSLASPVTVNGGTLGGTGSVGSVTVNAGDLQTSAGATFTCSGALTLQPPWPSPATLVSGAGTLQLRRVNSGISSPDIQYASSVGDNYAATLAGNLNLGNSPRYVVGYSNENPFILYGGDLDISAAVSGGGSLTFQGYPNVSASTQMTFVLGGSNAGFTGPVVLDQGLLVLNNPAALSGANALTLNPTSGTQAAGLFLYGTSATIGSLSGTTAGSMYIRNGSLVNDPYSYPIQSSATLTVNQTASGTFNGAVSDGPNENGDAGTYYSLGLTKTGSATLTLGGSNTFTGPMTINQGKLVVDGWLTNSAVSVNGGTLGGTGHLGSVTVNTGGQLAPGDSVGTLNMSGSLILEAGAVMDYELDTPSTSDMISCGSLALNLQQISDFNITPTANFGPGTYDLIAFGSYSGSLGANTSGMIDGYTATLAIQGNNDLVLIVTPEPSTLALLAAGAVGAVGYGLRWRRKSRLEAESTASRHNQTDDVPTILSFPSRSPWAEATRRAV